MAEPQLPENTAAGMAYRGQKVLLADYPSKPLKSVKQYTEEHKVPGRHITYEPSIEELSIDHIDLQKINKALVELRVRLHQVRNDYRTARRSATLCKHSYDSQKKRTLIQLSGGSKESREALADIMCQDAHIDWMVAETVAAELKDLSAILRTELDALKEISNNFRKQMDLQ